MSDPLARLPARAKAEQSLFDILPPPATFTPQQEAYAAASARANERYTQIMELIRSNGPMTCWEIARALGCQLNAISGRLSELKTQRMIESTGERRPNPATGKSGEVLRIVNSNNF